MISKEVIRPAVCWVIFEEKFSIDLSHLSLFIQLDHGHQELLERYQVFPLKVVILQLGTYT